MKEPQSFCETHGWNLTDWQKFGMCPRCAPDTAPQIKLTLPMPPSVNGLYRNVPGRGRVPTGLYQRWKDAADGALWTQARKPIVGQVNITITLEDRGRYDCDNKIKAVQDFLVRHGLIEDDDKRIVRKVTAQVGDVKGCLVEVEAA